jgi:hypothetical protein
MILRLAALLHCDRCGALDRIESPPAAMMTSAIMRPCLTVTTHALQTFYDIA